MLPRVGIALLPIFNVADRVTVAYEVLPRPYRSTDDPRIVRHALEAAAYTAPAVLLVPMPAELLQSPGSHARDLARDAAADPSEITWILPRDPGSSASRDRVGELRAAGFRIALEADGWESRGHERLIDLRPDYLLLDSGVIALLRDGDVGAAELAGLLSFTARIDTLLIARGVDDAEIATAVTTAGVQRGSGAFLSSPLVLDPAVALAGDEVVDRSWFRHNEPRRIGAQGRTQPARVQVLSLPEMASGPVSPDVFAHTLGEAARMLQAQPDPEQILAVIADLLPRVISMNALAIFEADWDTDSLIPRILSGEEVGALRDLPYPMSRGITGWAFSRGLPYNCGNTLIHPAAGTIPGTEADQVVESMLVVPLIAGDHQLGVIDAWRDGEDSFTDRDLEYCALFAHLTAAAWRNAQLYRELEARARTDALTGLHNTRWWDEVSPQKAARSLRAGSEIGVLVLDLDHFKQVNDTGGHAAGDRTLRNVARVLRSIVRTGDDVVRFGGEEFLILLHDSGIEGATGVADAVRQAIADMPPAVGEVRVTASVGVGVFPSHGATLDEVVRAADLAMYRAKSDGRNRVVLAAAATAIADTG